MYILIGLILYILIPYISLIDISILLCILYGLLSISVNRFSLEIANNIPYSFDNLVLLSGLLNTSRLCLPKVKTYRSLSTSYNINIDGYLNIQCDMPVHIHISGDKAIDWKHLLGRLHEAYLLIGSPIRLPSSEFINVLFKVSVGLKDRSVQDSNSGHAPLPKIYVWENFVFSFGASEAKGLAYHIENIIIDSGKVSSEITIVLSILPILNYTKENFDEGIQGVPSYKCFVHSKHDSVLNTIQTYLVRMLLD